MLSISLLTVFSTWVLLAPPSYIADVLDVMSIPSSARMTLLGAVILNAVLSLALEKWAPLATMVSWVARELKGRRKRSIVKDGKLYKAVEGGMRH